MPELCIAIPTYNRREHLQRRLAELIPQLTPEVRLHVFDNGSTDGTREAVLAAGAAVTYSRSEQNLGMCRNFIRCFEETEGDWLWILGDDDPVEPHCVQKALALVRRTGDGIINFSTSCGRNDTDKTIRSLPEYFAGKDVTSIMYVTANLYFRRSILSSLRVLAPASFTVAPNVAIILHALQSGSARLHLSTETLVIHEDNPRRWSGLEVSLGLSVFPEFLTQPADQRTAALGLRAGTRWMLLWGLVELDEPSAIPRWKRICRQTNANLAAYGATFFRSVVHEWTHGRLPRRELILQVLMRLPSSLILGAAQRMKTKNAPIFGTVLHDFQ